MSATNFYYSSSFHIWQNTRGARNELFFVPHMQRENGLNRNVWLSTCDLCYFALCVHNVYILFGWLCRMRLVDVDMVHYQPVWAGLGMIWLESHTTLLRCCQAEEPGQPPWFPPEPRCDPSWMSPSGTPQSNRMAAHSSLLTDTALVFVFICKGEITLTAFECMSR